MIQNDRQEHDNVAAPPRQLLGHIYAVTGSRTEVALLGSALTGPHRDIITVGKFVKIRMTRSSSIGVITYVSTKCDSNTDLSGDHLAIAHVHLMGQIQRSAGSSSHFRRGVSNYPTIGDVVEPLTNLELQLIFEGAGEARVSIGFLQQDESVNVCIDVNEMLNKHFAILGSTGVGKSSAVAHLLRQTMAANPHLRIFLLDAHNEYDRCFGQQSFVVSPANLKLPFWLFNFEEIVDVLFEGRPGVQDEIELLSEAIPIAKNNYGQHRTQSERTAVRKLEPRSIGCTVDTPVPYRITDLISTLDERMGKLENRTIRMVYNKLITRIEAVSNDPRYGFMFENANVGGDTMVEAISQLFRLPANDKPITVMQLAGFPTEVIDAVVSVLTRMAFDFGVWSDGSDPLLFVCEEAHKYASADRVSGFIPTRRALSRIAKEGRKYGVYLGIVTQRPAEIDPTIISQCGTIIAMRLSNDKDQELLRSAVADSASNLLAFVPSLGTREALAFGTGIALPARVAFAELPEALIPKSETFAAKSNLRSQEKDLSYIGSIVDRWRMASMSRNSQKGEIAQSAGAGPASISNPSILPKAPDSDKFGLLKRPISEQTVAPAGIRQSVQS